MRVFVSVKSVGYYRALFIGTFVASMLGVALIGVVALAISATQHIPSSSLGPQITLTTQEGISQTFSRDALDVQGIATALGLGAVISGFMTITGVTSACSFAIALRRRDLGLFRLFGLDGKH